jgi:hypothetical protein
MAQMSERGKQWAREQGVDPDRRNGQTDRRNTQTQRRAERELHAADRPRKDVEGDEDYTHDKPKLWRAAELKPGAQPRWLAANRLPRAAVSLLIGDEGIGKSLLWVLVVTHITTGKPFPGFGIPARDPGRVILVCTEDDWSTVVRPRLEVAGADLDMIRVVCVERDGSGSPVFPQDLGLIRNADPKPDLVVVDCWLDTVPGVINVRDPHEARAALHPWKDIATGTDAAIWLLAHSNRVATGSVRDRYGATYVLRQKARMTIWAMADDDGGLLAGPEKANGAIITVATRFTIKPILHFTPTDDHDGTVPLLEYDRLSDQTIHEHVDIAAQAAACAVAPGASGSDAAIWLALELAAGPCWSTDIEAAASSAGISKKRLWTAKTKCKVGSGREGGDGPWYMFLPQHRGLVPGPQIPFFGPIFPGGESGESGESPDSPSTSLDVQIPSESYIRESGKGDLACACGAQLTSPAEVRYGSCLDCRTTPSKQSEQWITPAGHGRCTSCGFHIDTQGHRDGCTVDAPEPESATDADQEPS